MAIYYPLQMPSNKGMMRAAVRARSVVGMSRSPFSGSQQVYQWPGEWWEAECTLPQMARADAEQWAAFLTSLRGPSGTFLLGDPAAKTPMGAASGSLPISHALTDNPAGAASMTFRDDFSGNVAGYLLPGDYLQICENQLTAAYSLADASWSSATVTKATGQVGVYGYNDAALLTPTNATDSFITSDTGCALNNSGRVPGLAFTLTMWLKASAAFTLHIGVIDQTFAEICSSNVSVTTAFQRFTLTGLALSTSATLRPIIGGLSTWITTSPTVTAWYVSITSQAADGRLHKVLNWYPDATFPTVTGWADIFPRLRETIIPESRTFFNNPVGTFRLQDSSVEWDEDKAKIYSLGFKAIEAI